MSVTPENIPIKLGATYVDRLTGFTGIASGHVVYLTGSAQTLIQPKAKEDGSLVDPLWFDDERLVAVVQAAGGNGGRPRRGETVEQFRARRQEDWWTMAPEAGPAPEAADIAAQRAARPASLTDEDRLEWALKTASHRRRQTMVFLIHLLSEVDTWDRPEFYHNGPVLLEHLGRAGDQLLDEMSATERRESYRAGVLKEAAAGGESSGSKQQDYL